MRPVVQVVLAALGVGLVATVRLSPPEDIGTWAPAALSGEVVLALGGAHDGVLVGTARGLHHVSPDGTRRDLGVTGAVRALAAHADGTYVGTADGLLDLAPGAGSAAGPLPPPVLGGTDVAAVDTAAGTVLVGAATGLLRQRCR